MALDTNAAPIRHSDLETNLGYAYVFAAEQIRQELHDMLDPLDAALGFSSLWGDVSSSGSDVLRITYVGGVGMQRTMTALTSETDAAPLASIRTGFSALTVAPYGIADSESFFHRILTREQSVTLEAIVAQTPGTVSATIRSQLAVQGAGITANSSGAVGTELSVDDILSVMADARSAFASGQLSGMVHPVQVNQLIQSMRAEPGFQGSVQGFQMATNLAPNLQVIPNVMGLQLTLGSSGDVTTSGGGYEGFITDPGAVGWGRASTAPLQASGMQNAIYIPEFGVVIQETGSEQNNQQRRVNAFAYLGFALGDEDVFFQSALISTT